MIKRCAVGLVALLATIAMLAAPPAYAASGPPGVSSKQALCSYTYQNRCAEPDAAGSLPVTLQGGCIAYHLAGGSAATTNATLIAAGAHSLYSLTVINTTATVYYLRTYDLGVPPAPSSATGVTHSYPVPGSTSGAGFVISFPLGESYANGLAYVLTGGGGDTDNTSAAVGVYINACYK